VGLFCVLCFVFFAWTCDPYGLRRLTRYKATYLLGITYLLSIQLKKFVLHLS
jgi:hypothetical protein